MKDTFGRNITYLRLSVTELCNLRCRYCMPAEGVCKKRHEDMLTEDEMIQAVEIAAKLGIRKVRITGGEPLLKKNILSICRRTAAIEGIEEVCMTTNGILLPKLAKALKEVGVDRINISLDTLDAEKYEAITRIGSLEQALKGLDAALEVGFEKIKINTVLIGGFNEDEIEKMAALTKEYPVDVRFIELMPMYGESGFTAEAFLPCETVLERLPELISAEQQEGVARLYRFPDGKGNVGLISPVYAHFCRSCDRLRLTADGKLKPCLHSAAEFSIKGKAAAEIQTIMEQAILAKPACHGELTYGSQSGAKRNMNQIGG